MEQSFQFVHNIYITFHHKTGLCQKTLKDFFDPEKLVHGEKSADTSLQQQLTLFTITQFVSIALTTSGLTNLRLVPRGTKLRPVLQPGLALSRRHA